MSADRIDKCPQCDEFQMRENWDIGFLKDKTFILEYDAECRNCGFHVAFKKQMPFARMLRKYKVRPAD